METINIMRSMPSVLVFGLLFWSAGNGLAQPQTQFNVKNMVPSVTASN